MRKVWIIVANQAEAKIYRAENVNTLIEHAVLFHDEGRLEEHDLVSDKQGSNRGAFGTDTMEPSISVKRYSAMLFASELCHFMEKGVQNEGIERFYLVANPTFLGILRGALSPQLTSLVAGEIHKDVVRAKPDEIRHYLPPVL